jgi:hypothetical protein
MLQCGTWTFPPLFLSRSQHDSLRLKQPVVGKEEEKYNEILTSVECNHDSPDIFKFLIKLEVNGIQIRFKLPTKIQFRIKFSVLPRLLQLLPACR